MRTCLCVWFDEDDEWGDLVVGNDEVWRERVCAKFCRWFDRLPVAPATVGALWQAVPVPTWLVYIVESKHDTTYEDFIAWLYRLVANRSKA